MKPKFTALKDILTTHPQSSFERIFGYDIEIIDEERKKEEKEEEEKKKDILLEEEQKSYDLETDESVPEQGEGEEEFLPMIEPEVIEGMRVGEPRLVVEELISRMREDVISKAEDEARKKMSEAWQKGEDIVGKAREEASKIIDEAIHKSLGVSHQIEKEAEEKGYKRGYEEGYKEGVEKGVKDGFEKVSKEGEEAINLLTKLSQELTDLQNRIDKEFDEMVLSLSLSLTKKIVLSQTLKDEEIVVRTLKDAISRVKDFELTKIRLNTQDVDTVKKFFKLPQEIIVEPDENVQRGDVVLEMREGYLESTKDWRIKKLEEVLEHTMIKKESSDFEKSNQSQSQSENNKEEIPEADNQTD